ncbi:MAG: DUF1365 family protein [Candidatus Azotimanducaceae bacterium]|jgi:DUF1365 family protein
MNPALLCNGVLRHARRLPKQHQFSYRVFMLCVDLDQLEQTIGSNRWISLERFNLLSYRRGDFAGDKDQPLSEHIRQLVEQHSGQRPSGPVRLLANFACLGYSLNPITIYWCHDRKDKLTHMVGSVTSTPWGQRQDYVFSVPDNRDGRFELHNNKQLHVSPFMNMDMQYHWKIRYQPDQPIGQAGISVRIEAIEKGQPMFTAALSLTPQPLTSRSLLHALVRHPMMTGRVLIAIYWQALRLWRKHIPYIPHPDKSSSKGHR